MLAVEPGGRSEGDKELRAIGIGSCVGHAENASAGVLEGRVDLVSELVTVDGGAASAGAGRIAALDHEVGNDAVEDGAVVVAAADERREVVARLGRVGRVELEGEGALEVKVSGQSSVLLACRIFVPLWSRLECWLS